MTLLEAYNITRVFETNYEKEKPFSSSEIELIKTTIDKKVKYYYWIHHHEDDRIIAKMMSKKKYNSYDIKEKHNNIMTKKRIEEKMFLTSIGLVSEEDFYLAEDIMENTKFLKKKDLEIDSVYLDVKGREFLYTGNLIMNQGYMTEKIYKSQLFDIKNNRFLNLSSLKLVEFSYEYKKDIHIDIIYTAESKRLK